MRDPLKNARLLPGLLVGDALPDGEAGLGDRRGDCFGLLGDSGDPILGNFLAFEGEEIGETGCCSSSVGIEGHAVS